MIENLFFDTDLLGDDFFALYGIIRHNDIHLKGITSFGRRSSALDRAKMAQVFLQINGAEGIDIVPGADKPIMLEKRKSCTFCDEQMGWLRKDWDASLAYCCRLIGDMKAAEYLIRKAHELDRISLLCTGPLTNIALAILLDSTFPSHVEKLYFMGGVRNIQGNSSPVAESNVLNDPEAASIVFRSIPSIHIIPYDITMQFVITEEEALGIPDKFFREVAISCCRSHACRKNSSSIMPMHDYLAYLSLADESIIGYEDCDIMIETSGSLCRGMMLFLPGDRLHDKFGSSVDIQLARKYLSLDFGVVL